MSAQTNINDAVLSSSNVASMVFNDLRDYLYGDSQDGHREVPPSLQRLAALLATREVQQSIESITAGIARGLASGLEAAPQVPSSSPSRPVVDRVLDRLLTPQGETLLTALIATAAREVMSHQDGFDAIDGLLRIARNPDGRDLLVTLVTNVTASLLPLLAERFRNRPTQTQTQTQTQESQHRPVYHTNTNTYDAASSEDESSFVSTSLAPPPLARQATPSPSSSSSNVWELSSADCKSSLTSHNLCTISSSDSRHSPINIDGHACSSLSQPYHPQAVIFSMPDPVERVLHAAMSCPEGPSILVDYANVIIAAVMRDCNGRERMSEMAASATRELVLTVFASVKDFISFARFPLQLEAQPDSDAGAPQRVRSTDDVHRVGIKQVTITLVHVTQGIVVGVVTGLGEILHESSLWRQMGQRMDRLYVAIVYRQ